MFDSFKLKLSGNWKGYVAAGIAGLVAVNGVLHFVPDSTLTQILSIASMLGLYMTPSPVKVVKTGD